MKSTAPERTEAKSKMETTDVEVRRFEPGDSVSFPTKEFSGYYSMKAEEGGYQVRMSGICLVVTDEMLSCAPRIGSELDREIIRRKCKPSNSRRVSIGEAAWMHSRSLRLYSCQCLGKSYDSESYNRWMDELKSGIAGDGGKGTYWKEVHGDTKPVDWPDSWTNGTCTECGAVISCDLFGTEG